MERFTPFIERVYRRSILKYPLITLLLLLSLTLFFAYQIKDFRLDASAETLVLDDDEDLNYFRQLSERFGQQDYRSRSHFFQKCPGQLRPAGEYGQYFGGRFAGKDQGLQYNR